MKPLERLLVAALTLVGVAWLLQLAWSLLRPLLPIIVGLAVVGCTATAIVRVTLRRREYW